MYTHSDIRPASKRLNLAHAKALCHHWFIFVYTYSTYVHILETNVRIARSQMLLSIYIVAPLFQLNSNTYTHWVSVGVVVSMLCVVVIDNHQHHRIEARYNRHHNILKREFYLPK